MAWTTPRTWIPYELVTDTMLNTHVRDNLNAVSRVVTQLTTVAGIPNAAGVDTQLYQYVIPAQLLAADGDALELRLSGTFAANSNIKRIVGFIGGATIFDTAAVTTTGGGWHVHIELRRVGAGVLLTAVQYDLGQTTIAPSTHSAAMIWANANTFTVLAYGTAAADVVFYTAMVDLKRSGI